jgi:hypothetical protein
MPRYEDSEISFETPDDWEDRSMVAHVGDPDAAGTTPTVLVTREPMLEGETLDGYRDRLLVDLAKQLKDLEVYESREARIDGRPAIALRYTLDGPEGVIEQTLTMVEALSPDQKRIVVTFASAVPASSAQANRQRLEGVLKTVRFVPPGGAPPPLAPPPLALPPNDASPPLAAPSIDVPYLPYVPIPGYRRK